MQFKDIVNLYFERSNALQTYWSFYTTMVLALLAFFGSMKASRQKKLIAFVLSIAFISFTSVNLDALKGVTKARIACRDLILSGKLDDSPSQEIQQQVQRIVTPWSFVWVAAIHISGDIFTLAAIWFMVLRGPIVEEATSSTNSTENP